MGLLQFLSCSPSPALGRKQRQGANIAACLFLASWMLIPGGACLPTSTWTKELYKGRGLGKKISMSFLSFYPPPPLDESLKAQRTWEVAPWRDLGKGSYWDCSVNSLHTFQNSTFSLLPLGHNSTCRLLSWFFALCDPPVPSQPCSNNKFKVTHQTLSRAKNKLMGNLGSNSLKWKLCMHI